MNDEEFREDLVNMLVNGINLSFMDFVDVLDVIDFTEELVKHYMLDERLSEMFFWHDDGVILRCKRHTIKFWGCNITSLNTVQNRTERSIDNLKNAGRILMSTIAFVGKKLEIIEESDYKDKIQKLQEKSKVLVEENNKDDEEESESSSEDLGYKGVQNGKNILLTQD